jgi:hypothetical protein
VERGVFVATTNHHSKITNIDYGRNHQSYRKSLLIYIYTLVGTNETEWDMGFHVDGIEPGLRWLK